MDKDKVVKIKVDDFGEKIDYPKWCYVHIASGSEAALCSGQVFGAGESSVIYEQKVGKITCPDCIEIIKKIKKVKL